MYFASTCIRNVFLKLTQSPAVPLNVVIFNFGNFVVLETAAFSISNFFSATSNSASGFPSTTHTHVPVVLHMSKCCSSSNCCSHFKSSYRCIIFSSLSSRHFLSLWLWLRNAAHFDVMSFLHCLTIQGDSHHFIFNSSVCEINSDSFVMIFTASVLTISISISISSMKNLTFSISFSISFMRHCSSSLGLLPSGMFVLTLWMITSLLNLPRLCCVFLQRILVSARKKWANQ